MWEEIKSLPYTVSTRRSLIPMRGGVVSRRKWPQDREFAASLSLLLCRRMLLGPNPEGEFMNAILSRVFWEKTQVFCDSSVCWGFYLRFFLLQNAIHEETQVDLSLFSSRIFFVRIFKTRLEYGFLSGFFVLNCNLMVLTLL